MNKKDLVSAVSDEAGINKDQAAKAVDSVFNAIEKTMKDGDEVRIPGFGTFKVSKRAAREGVVPGTNEKRKYPATKVPKFTPSKTLKDLLN
ncbi:MAG: HU family DNA-binding protein [Hyphomicrobiaceae bacterium]